MNIYISGISGTGMGPLAIMAKRAGFSVFGSDLSEGAVSGELFAEEIPVKFGPQDGKFLQECHNENKIDWFVHTSALPKDAPELKLAEKLNLRISKRDELIAYLVEKLGLKMVAIAGTHGKTTTTALITWASLKLGLPVSYLVGSTLPFAEAGNYADDSKFLIYEADEYDRNFLKFNPWLSILTCVSYDHPDIYPTIEDYQDAFKRFIGQSEQVIIGEAAKQAARGVKAAKGEPENIQSELEKYQIKSEDFTLAGEARREDARLAFVAITKMLEELGREMEAEKIVEILNQFPGVGRRFERIADGVYTDYAHHPEEIAATIEIAKEEAKNLGLKGVVAVYEPHQNTRQHEVKDGYKNVFEGADDVFWLPTYLTREDPNLKILSPADFIAGLSNSSSAHPAELNQELSKKLHELKSEGKLILLMTAGPADKWFRDQNW